MQVADRTAPFVLARSSPLRYLARVAAALLVVCVLMWAAFVALLWINEPRLVFNAGRTRLYSPPLELAAFEPVTFKSADGIDLEAAALRAPAAGYWILFCPPSGLSIHASRLQEQLQQLREFGYNVLAFDYRGFGRTRGVPSEQGLYADALAAYRYLTGDARVPPQHVILAGRSLGSAVAVELAERVPAGGLLLLSPIDSVPMTGARLYPWAPVFFLATNRFDNSAKVSRLRLPVLVVHSPNDRLVPIAAVRQLFQRIPGRKVMLETGGGHNRAGFAPGTRLKETMGELWPDF